MYYKHQKAILFLFVIIILLSCNIFYVAAESGNPLIDSLVLSPDNRFADVFFNEAVFAGNPFGGPLNNESLLPVLLHADNGLRVSIEAISKPTEIYPNEDTLLGGESTVRVFLQYSGVTTGEEELGFVSAKDSSVADIDLNYLSSEIVTATAPLNYLPPKNTIIEVTTCSDEFYFAGGDYRDSSGVYFDTINTTYGYDSILITRLSVNSVRDTLVNVNLCEGESYFVEGSDRELPGLYVDTLLTVMGCDSIVITNLEVFPNYETSKDVKITIGDTYFAGGKEQSEPGIYEDHYLSVYGCDSLVITYLEFSEATNSSYLSEKSFKIYPVPTKGILNISDDDFNSIEIYDINGNRMGIFHKQLLDLSHLDNGVYYLLIRKGDGNRIKRKILIVK